MPDELDADDSDMPPDWADPPWYILFPGLSEARARALLKLAEGAGLSFGGEVLSPKWHFSFGLDRVTSQWLRAALSDHDSRVLSPSGETMEWITPDLARERLEGVIEDLDEFLANGERYPAEDGIPPDGAGS